MLREGARRITRQRGWCSRGSVHLLLVTVLHLSILFPERVVVLLRHDVPNGVWPMAAATEFIWFAGRNILHTPGVNSRA
ncbi:Uncharacterised protein [Edwardsiella tarda]|nr:Uncharacterised protein [Edwardsiella tarda]